MKSTIVRDHLGNRISVGSPVISGNGRGPHCGIVEDIGGKHVRIRAGGHRPYLPPVWFFSRPACGWVLATKSREYPANAVSFDVVKRGKLFACVKATSLATAIEQAIKGGVSGIFSVARSTKGLP